MDMFPASLIPDLSGLKPLAERLIVGRALLGTGSWDAVAYTLQFNTVRILDAAIADYERGRMHVLGFQNRDPSEFALAHFAAGISAFESCLWNLERFLKHAKVLRSHKDAEPELKALIPGSLELFKGEVEGFLTKTRHALAHLEGETRGGARPQGETIALAPTASGLVLGKITLPWTQLAGWLNEAHRYIAHVALFGKSGGGV